MGTDAKPGAGQERPNSAVCDRCKRKVRAIRPTWGGEYWLYANHRLPNSREYCLGSHDTITVDGPAEESR